MPPLMAVAAIVIFAATYPSGTHRDRPALPFDPEEIAIALGLGIDEVSVSGHRRTLESQIFRAIDMTRMRSEVSLDTALIRRRLESLPWIKRAHVSRRFPGGLDIVIEERTPAAVTKLSGRPTLLDIDGRVLGLAGGYETGLVRIDGAGAHTRLRRLLTVLDDYPEVRDRLREAERIGERRWTLHLVTGTRLLLPHDDDGRADAAALAEIVKQWPRGGGRLIDRPLAVIDARISHRLVIREVGTPADATSPAGN
jgi:cell division protein FtsQ